MDEQLAFFIACMKSFYSFLGTLELVPGVTLMGVFLALIFIAIVFNSFLLKGR